MGGRYDAQSSRLTRGSVVVRRRGRSAAPALALSGVTRRYPCSTGPAIRDVTLEIAGGQVTALVGSSGSGKSTLLLCAAGLLRPDAGHVAWFGRRFPGGGCVPGVAYVSPANGFYGFLTPRDVLEYFCESGALDGRSEIIESCIARAGLEELTSVTVARLSRSELARLRIAVALASDPCAILLDSILEELSAADLELVSSILLREARGGLLVLLGSRDRRLVEPIAARIVALEQGRIVPELSLHVAERVH